MSSSNQPGWGDFPTSPQGPPGSQQQTDLQNTRIREDDAKRQNRLNQGTSRQVPAMDSRSPTPGLSAQEISDAERMLTEPTHGSETTEELLTRKHVEWAKKNRDAARSAEPGLWAIANKKRAEDYVEETLRDFAIAINRRRQQQEQARSQSSGPNPKKKVQIVKR